MKSCREHKTVSHAGVCVGCLLSARDALLAEVASLKKALQSERARMTPSTFPNEHLLDLENGNPVTMSFSRSWGSSTRVKDMERRDFVLTITDKVSGALIAEVCMTPIEYLRAFVQNEGYVPSVVKWYGIDRIGMKCERKLVRVQVTDEDWKARPSFRPDPERDPELRDWAMQVIRRQGLLKDG